MTPPPNPVRDDGLPDYVGRVEAWAALYESENRMMAALGLVSTGGVQEQRAADLTALLADRARLVEEVARLSETFVDERGVTWCPPTAWAYMAVCGARDKWEARALAAEAHAERMERGAAEQENVNFDLEAVGHVRYRELLSFEQRFRDERGRAERMAEALKRACDAADNLLVGVTAEIGRALYEAPDADLVPLLTSYKVELPAHLWLALYRSTERSDLPLKVGG